MNLWENIARGASEVGQMAVNPKTYRTLEHLVNTGGQALQGGYNTLQQNPYIGPYVTGAGIAAQQAINAPVLQNIKENPMVRAGMGALTGFSSLNPLIGATVSQLPKLLPDTQSPSQEQLQSRLQNIQESQTAFDLSRAKEKGRKKAAESGDIHDWKETLLNQAVYLPKFGGELISGAGEFITGGLGEDWDKSWQEKGYEQFYESFERENKNKIFFGEMPFISDNEQKENYGIQKLSEMSPEVKQYLPDDVFRDIYEGNVSSKYDLDKEFKKATQIYETDSIVRPLLLEKVSLGEISQEEAMKAYSEHLNEQKLREFATYALTDPLMYVDPGHAIKPIQKGLGLVKEVLPKVGSQIKKASRSKDVLTGKKVSSVIDESDKIVQDIDNVIKEVETPQIKEIRGVSEGISQKSKLTESQFNRQKRNIVENPNIPFEEKQQMLKQLANQTKFKKVDPKLGKVESQAAKQRAREIQEAHPGLDNKDTAEVMLNESRRAIQKEADDIANTAWHKMKQYGGPEVIDTPLTSTYTPPKVSLTPKNTMKSDQAVNPLPIEIQFRNPIQKLFYELSLPYNRAIIEGYGMDFNQHKQIMSNMTKNFAEPLTKILTGGFAPDKIQKTKRIMGAVGSELAKKSINHTPGTPLIFDNLKVSEMLDNFLLSTNQAPSIKKSVLGSLTEAPVIKAPKASVSEAGEELLSQYDKITSYFTGIGIPENVAKKTAVFYNRVIEKSSLSGAGAITEAAEEGITAGKAFNVDILNDLDGLDRSIAIELHEDFHQLFDYMRTSTDNPRAVSGIIKDALTKDIPDAGNKLYNQIKKALKQIDTDDSIILDEAMSYFVQSKNELRKGIFTDNPVSKVFASIMRRASNGDENARKLLDNFEGVEQAVRQHGDEFEKQIVLELKNITLPDGQNAWSTINRVNPETMKGLGVKQTIPTKSKKSIRTRELDNKDVITKEDLEDLINSINSIQDRVPSRINYHIN